MKKLNSKSLYEILGLWFKGVPVKEIADNYQISACRVYQIISHYKRTHKLLKLKDPGRPPKPISKEDVKLILDYRSRTQSGALTLEHLIESEKGLHIPHTRIHEILQQYGLSKMSEKKRVKPSYIRYEKEFSMEMWQGDWKYYVYPDGRKTWLIAFMDDASRLITCYGLYDSPTTENTIETLERGFKIYGLPDAVLTDHGSQFTSVNAKNSLNHDFEAYLHKKGISHILARVRHPQTNGKIERFLGELERRGDSFETSEEYISWHNEMKPHMSLNYTQPFKVFWNKMQPDRVMEITKRLMNEA